jgi:hypothetical protein
MVNAMRFYVFPCLFPSFVCCDFVNFEQYDFFFFFLVVMRVGEVFVRESDDSTCWLGDMLISIKIR